MFHICYIILDNMAAVYYWNCYWNVKGYESGLTDPLNSYELVWLILFNFLIIYRLIIMYILNFIFKYVDVVTAINGRIFCFLFADSEIKQV